MRRSKGEEEERRRRRRRGERRGEESGEREGGRELEDNKQATKLATYIPRAVVIHFQNTPAKKKAQRRLVSYKCERPRKNSPQMSSVTKRPAPNQNLAMC